MAKTQRYPHLLGSKWTAQQCTLGWRHFHVVNRKNQGPWIFAELEASCDRTVRFWINAKLLKDREVWLPGWRELTTMQAQPAAEKLPRKREFF